MTKFVSKNSWINHFLSKWPSSCLNRPFFVKMDKFVSIPAWIGQICVKIRLNRTNSCQKTIVSTKFVSTSAGIDQICVKKTAVSTNLVSKSTNFLSTSTKFVFFKIRRTNLYLRSFSICVWRHTLRWGYELDRYLWTFGEKVRYIDGEALFDI